MTFFTHPISLLLLAVVVLASCSSEEKIEGVVFPDAEYSKVVAYDYEGLKGDNIYDFKNQKLYHSIKNEQELNKEQINSLLDVINDEKSYGGDVTRCFKPRLGVVFYNAAGKAKAEISICFECNQHQSTPSILAQGQAKAASALSLHGYSNEGRQKLLDFCKSLNFTNCGTVEPQTEASSIH